MTDFEPLAHHFAADGEIPNNPRLPVLIYAQAVDLHGDPAVVIEHLFQQNGWPPEWRNGVYEYHHYHSTAHEALGIAQGKVTVRLGGENGKDFELRAGDVLVLPAGTGHKRLSASDDLLVVGAYPEGQGEDYDLLRGKPGELRGAKERIEKVPMPGSDPVFGEDGPLTSLWRE